jgi:LPPG:FO 2-phospho-L-lactate transferase
MLDDGIPLSEITKVLQRGLGLVDVEILPASNDSVRTWVQIENGHWLEFQEYFVDRSHADPVRALAYHGAAEADAGPDVVDAIDAADTLVVAPSNPPLSIWPILAIDDIEAAVRRHHRRVAISPLFGGAALKGPAAQVMSGIGLSPGTKGVLEAYRDLIDHLFVDEADAADLPLGAEFGVAIHTGSTRLSTADEGAAFAADLIEQVMA